MQEEESVWSIREEEEGDPSFRYTSFFSSQVDPVFIAQVVSSS